MASMAASVSSSLSTGSIPFAAARTRGCKPARSAAGTPTSSPMTAMGSGRANSAMKSTSPRGGQVVEQVVDQGSMAGPQALDLARRERARHQPAQAGVVRRVRQQHVVLGRVEEFAPAGAGVAEDARSRCPRCPCHVRAAGRAARPGTPRSR